MKRLQAIGMALAAMVACGAIAASNAQAGEGPFWEGCVAKEGGHWEDSKCSEEGVLEDFESKRLVAGEKKKMLSVKKLPEPIIISNGKVKLKCTELVFDEGKIFGSEAGTAGSGAMTFEFSGCEVEGNGKPCEVEKKEITTERLELWLGKEKQATEKKEPFLVGFKPEELGHIFAKVKFVGAACTIKEGDLEIAKEKHLAIAGILKNEGEHKLEMEIAETETFGSFGYIDFPATLLKKEFVEINKKVEEVDVGLTMFGMAVTRFEGAIKLELMKYAWGAFGKLR
jgi:hypothetical protein